MDKLISLTIDGRPACVPAGTLVVDAAKMTGIDIPVFCYHPKLEPVGMCRMCLVDIGRPAIDRATGQPILNEDGTPKITFGPKLETACTTPVSEGMVIWGATEKVLAARKDVIEFLLTSHPLDCPVCDKGGECPLQNQTMEFGAGKSRFIFDEKSHNEKHVPLGELIYLDRERCIQCARCVRFSDQVAGDPVIGFYQRGRQLEIVTHSDPGFDSVFSGNTTDICPVGALTTADFRFGARPWEMTTFSAVCTQCPVGCNISYSVRREAKSSGKFVIKRVLPRQNEAVNELWLCDKGRFGYHFGEATERLDQPLVRKNGELVKVSWAEALRVVAENFKAAGKRITTLAGGRLYNEDLHQLKKFSRMVEGKHVFASAMGGGEYTTRYGLSPDSDLGKLGKGDAILVFASDLHEEAPIWWLRLKQASERGATLVVANGRKTRLDAHASFTLRYQYGEEEAALRQLIDGDFDSAKALREAANLVVFYGSDGLGLTQTQAVAGYCAELLTKSNHTGRANNGLVAVWPHANDEGATEMGWLPSATLAEDLSAATALYIVAADPAADSAELVNAIQKAGFVVVQDLYLSETAKLANVVLPVKAAMERDGSYVSGERRVQLSHCAVPAPEMKADFEVTQAIAKEMGFTGLELTPAQLFEDLAASEPVFSGTTYADMAQTHEQWPLTGRADAYFSGTTVENKDGLGVTLPLQLNAAQPVPVKFSSLKQPGGAWLALPITKLYDQGVTLKTSVILAQRIGDRAFTLNAEDAEKLAVKAGDAIEVNLDGVSYTGKIDVLEGQPQGTLLVRRSMGVPLTEAKVVTLRALAPLETETK